MTDPPPSPDTGVGDAREPTTGTPRWVVGFGLIAAIVGLLFVILHLAGGGPGGHTTPSSVRKDGGHGPAGGY